MKFTKAHTTYTVPLKDIPVGETFRFTLADPVPYMRINPSRTEVGTITNVCLNGTLGYSNLDIPVIPCTCVVVEK